MKAICALLVLLSIGKTYAQLVSRASCEPYANIQKTTSTLTCNNKDTVFRYINGVNNSETAAEEGLKKLIKLSIENLINGTKDNPSTVLDRGFIYNFSFVPADGLILGLYKDIVEAMAQKLITDFNVPTNEAWQMSFNILVDGPKNKIEEIIAKFVPTQTLQRLITDYLLDPYEFGGLRTILEYTNFRDTVKVKLAILNTLKNKQKMIVVTHSQGGLFLNQVWKELDDQGDPDFKNGKRWFTNLQIATPTSSNFPAKGGFLTNKDDFAALIANRSNMTGTESIAPGFNPDKIDSYLHHNLDTTYLSLNYPGYRDCAANAIIDAAEQLESNCTEQCTDEATETVYEARRQTNPDGKEGGIVALASTVEGDVHIDPLSVVCGSSTLKGKVSLWGKASVFDSTLDGSSGGVYVDGGDFPVHDVPVVPSNTDPANLVPNVVIRDSELKGNIYLWGKVRVLDSTLNGVSSGVYVYGGQSPNANLPMPSPNEEGFNGWNEYNVTIDKSEILANVGAGIDIVNSYVNNGKVWDEAFLLAGVLNGGTIREVASIEGGEADAFVADDVDLPVPELVISGDTIIKGTVVTQTKTFIESSFIDKKGLVSGNSLVRSSYVSGQVIGYDDEEASTERPMAELVNARLFEMGIVFNSGKMLYDAMIGHRNDPAVMVEQSFIFDKATLTNGAAFTNGAFISDSAYVGGNKVFMTKTHVFGNARVSSDEGGGTHPNSAIHESKIHGNAQVLGTPYVFQSGVFANAIVKNNQQVLKSLVGENLVLGGDNRYICSQLEYLPWSDEPVVTVNDCSNPNLETYPPAVIAARTIASVSVDDVASEQSIQQKLSREKSRVNKCSRRIKGKREKIVYEKVLHKIEHAEAEMTSLIATKKSRSNRRSAMTVKEAEKMHLEHKKHKKGREIALAKANRKNIRAQFNKFKKQRMKKRS